ncbi:MAG: hypothetical protein ACLQGP_32175 [Isosphaeraceae bacterium]
MACTPVRTAIGTRWPAATPARPVWPGCTGSETSIDGGAATADRASSGDFRDRAAMHFPSAWRLIRPAFAPGAEVLDNR